MAIREEVERANNPPTVTPQQAIQAELNRYRPVVTRLLTGTGISVEAFVGWTANAMRAQPQLWTCDQATVLGAVLKAAQLGLAPNDARNLCTIIPRGKQAHFQIGYGGVMELARRAVPGLRFDGRPVYPNDEFDVDYGKAEPLTHRPAIVLGQERGGDPYAWYVRAVWPDGAVQIEILDRDKVEYHRSFSQQPNGTAWTKSYDAMALKSCVMDLKRWLPSSAQLVAALAADDRTHTPETVLADSVDVGEATTGHEQQALPNGDPEPEP